MLNLKPARFGSVRRLFDAYDYCTAHGIGAYGGGMFEQGPGRGQLQYLASLFHPDGPNDLAPWSTTCSFRRTTFRALRSRRRHTRPASAGGATTGAPASASDSPGRTGRARHPGGLG
jgi:hypothetical protein